MLLDDLNRIRNEWKYLRNEILYYQYLTPNGKESAISKLIKLHNDVKGIISKYKDALMAAAIYNEFQRLLQSIHSLISALKTSKYEELNQRVSNVDSNFDRLLGLAMERKSVLENMSYYQAKREETKIVVSRQETPKQGVKEEKEEITLIERFKKGLQKTRKKFTASKKDEKEVKEKEEEAKTTKQKEEAKEEKAKESKEEQPKKGLPKIIRKIFIAPSIIFAFLSIYYLYLYNALYFLIFGLLAAIFYSVYKGKASPFFTWGVLIIVIGGIMYLWTSTAFAQYICLTAGYCPGASLGPKPDENYIAQIKESVSKVIKDMYMIMTNPEMYYLRQQAEAEALPESYQYLLEITPPYSMPLVYYDVRESDQEVNVSAAVPLLYVIRSSLPKDVGDIGAETYCIIIPKIDTSCISSGAFGDEIHDKEGKVIGYISNNTTPFLLPIYGLQRVLCKIPSFTLNLAKCGNLKNERFYINNEFILRLTNVTVTTYYKFLVMDVSLVVQAMKNNKDVYDYLRLNRYEYDKGYFKGFIDFPKINILRVGVLSKYPVIIFYRNESVEDVLYISLSNIEEIYNISGIKIDIIYNPNELNITTDYRVVSSFYNLTCNNQEKEGRLSCSIVFNYYPGVLGANKYILKYKEEADELIWFIPITVQVKENFIEYSEVLVVASATYGLQKEVTNSITYIPFLIPS